MPLILKLIGQFRDRKNYQIRDSFEGSINIRLLNDLFIFWGLSDYEVEKLKFITDSEQIKNPDKTFLVSPVEEKIIFVFTPEPELRNKLVTLFMKEGREVAPSISAPETKNDELQIKHVTQSETIDQEICQSINTTQVTIPILTEELIETMNHKSILLFSDPDFKLLVGIYLKKPELFSILAQYVQNGNIVEESLMSPKTINDLTNEELIKYQTRVEVINNLNLGISNDMIIEKLIKYSGHLNLTLRSILCDMAINK
jgi:hypothetical protein